MTAKVEAPSPLPETTATTRGQFAAIQAAGRPVVLRGLAAHWPIVAAARDLAGLRSALLAHATAEPVEAWFGPPEIGGRFDYNAAFDGYNHDRKLASIAQLLDLIERQAGHPAPWSVYAGAVPLRRHLPGLLDQVALPVLADPARMLVSLWLGNRTRVAPHWDLPSNLACVVAGRRRFTLFPPDQVGNLHVGPLDFTLAGQPTSLVDIAAPDIARFPRYANAARHALSAELGPGDAIYVPSLWWHGVESLEDVGAMINFWWKADGADTLGPRHALMLAALTIGRLPESERAGWRAFFDHYVFAGGDPMAHLPPHARGIFGARTPALVRALKDRIADALRR